MCPIIKNTGFSGLFRSTWIVCQNSFETFAKYFEQWVNVLNDGEIPPFCPYVIIYGLNKFSCLSISHCVIHRSWGMINKTAKKAFKTRYKDFKNEMHQIPLNSLPFKYFLHNLHGPTTTTNARKTFKLWPVTSNIKRILATSSTKL